MRDYGEERYIVRLDGHAHSAWNRPWSAIGTATRLLTDPQTRVAEVIDTAIPDRIFLSRKDSALVG